jgi:hypothetical protein
MPANYFHAPAFDDGVRLWCQSRADSAETCFDKSSAREYCALQGYSGEVLRSQVDAPPPGVTEARNVCVRPGASSLSSSIWNATPTEGRISRGFLFFLT